MDIREIREHFIRFSDKHGRAFNDAPPGTLPVMTVTRGEYEVLKEHGVPWTELEDGSEMWGGVVVEVEE